MDPVLCELTPGPHLADIWGLPAAGPALFGCSGCSDWSDLCPDWLVLILINETPAVIGQ
jgi:hypothetical protein